MLNFYGTLHFLSEKDVKNKMNNEPGRPKSKEEFLAPGEALKLYFDLYYTGF